MEDRHRLTACALARRAYPQAMADTLHLPPGDPTAIFEFYRGAVATELLVAATHHLEVFARVRAPMTWGDLRAALGLEERAATVLMTALRAMGLMARGGDGRIGPTALARDFLDPASGFSVAGYLGMQADSPGVVELARKLRADKPIGAHGDVSQFIFKEGAGSSMEQEASARALTLALAGRARAVAPILAERLELGSARTLIDVGGGTGLYAIACLQRYPGLRAVVWDRPEVLKVAAEHAARYGVADRLTCRSGDMFVDPVPTGDVVLLSNILHDWDVAECRRIVARCAGALPVGGRLVIHDVLLDDDLGGPLPIALYSAQLFAVTEGRAYSAAEYSGWLREAGLTARAPVPTLVHCAAIVGEKP